MPEFDPGVVMGIVGLGIVCLTIVALTYLNLKRRQPRELPSAAELREIRDRLGRMEQAIDSIAIETERISEGQRFTTRVLAESRRSPGLGGGESPLG